MVISNQKNKIALYAKHSPRTAPEQALDAPDYMHQPLRCHINRIDSSHKKINYPTPNTRSGHPCGAAPHVSDGVALDKLRFLLPDRLNLFTSPDFIVLGY